MRKAGQRTVRLTVAPGSWIVPTHLLFLLLFLRNTSAYRKSLPFDHVFDACCLLRGLGEKRETDLVAVHERLVSLQNLLRIINGGVMGKKRKGEEKF